VSKYNRIPAGTTHFKILVTATKPIGSSITDIKAVELTFYSILVDVVPVNTYPIAELYKHLDIAKCRKIIREKPLSERMDGAPDRVDSSNSAGPSPLRSCSRCGSRKWAGRNDDCCSDCYGHTVAAKTADDMVNHPPHYKAGDIECIDAIKAALTPEEYRGYLKGNVLKYTWRERFKGGIESMKKAIWYAERVED
jgi:hypothetical protein